MGLLTDLREIAQELLDDAGIDDKVGRAAHLIANALDDVLDKLADIVNDDDDVPTFDPGPTDPDAGNDDDGPTDPGADFDPVPPAELPRDSDPDTDHSNPEVLP